MSFCACMGPIGTDPLCPCRMRTAGLKATEFWTPQAIEELHQALQELFHLEQQAADKDSPE